MSHPKHPYNVLRPFSEKQNIYYYSLPDLESAGFTKIGRLPVSIRIILESLLRNFDGLRVKEEDIKNLARWNRKGTLKGDVPFIVSRVILQDFTGVPLLVDLAAMRDAAAERGGVATDVEPEVPVDLVVDHSVQVDRSGTEDAFLFNLEIEFERNRERYEFLKWGQDAFKTFKVVPPGIGIVHQVNLEHIATVVSAKQQDEKTILFPDTLVGTDSHTTMINGLGVLGWGVGGIEAEAAMLQEPVSLQMPEVVGVHLTGKLKEGVTATDLALRITEMLRKAKVVGKLVEFFGEGAASLSVADRATIGNMAPEYGATTGFFPVDDQTLDYLKTTGRPKQEIDQVKEYLLLQKLFGIPRRGEIDYTEELELDLNDVLPCVSGPKRPQDRIDLYKIPGEFKTFLEKEVSEGGYGKGKEKAPKVCIHPNGASCLDIPQDSGGTFDLQEKNVGWSEEEMVTNRPATQPVVSPGYSSQETESPKTCELLLTHGSIVIAAITSCTNTSNPSVMIAAGLLAKKAVEKGLKVNPLIKTSLAPGSRVVTNYLEKAGLQRHLDQLGFQLVAYGCTTCIGNSGPLDERIEGAIKDYDIVAASVLSGNRNFEARIHSAVKANFLMSPPLVVAFAIAGKVDIDMEKEPLGYGKDGPVFLRDIWPSSKEIEALIAETVQPEMFKNRYQNILHDNPVWKEIHAKKGARYSWDAKSTYIQKPPYFDDFEIQYPKNTNWQGFKALAIFGDSVTTDHISPAGSFKASSPAGQYLLSLGVKEENFNSYGSRRGNHHVMLRGTFANVRIRNQMADGKEGGYTKLQPEGTLMTIFEASENYLKRNIPLIVFAGKDYGMGSSRDWAAKGTALLGVKVVIAKSFERIHRSNLIGMGVLPLEFKEAAGPADLNLNGTETFSIMGFEDGFIPSQEIILKIDRGSKKEQAKLISRLDSPIEIECYRNGGILPFMLRRLLAKQ